MKRFRINQPRPAFPADAKESVGGGATLLFSLTIFLSAFLLFQIQPLIGKFILPWFGGTPGVWTTCMLVFQLLLFGGYAYAHLTTSRLSPKCQSDAPRVAIDCRHARAADCSQPRLEARGQTSSRSRGSSLLLAATVGLPFFVLSSTGPLLQGWFSRMHAGRSPYRLYALSNVGSLLALVSFPVVFDWAPSHEDSGVPVVVKFCPFCRFVSPVCAWWSPGALRPTGFRILCRQSRRNLNAERQTGAGRRNSCGLRWRWFLRSCSWRRRTRFASTSPASPSCGCCL